MTGWAARELARQDDEAGAIAELVGALDKHKERIKRLQEALCECSHRERFRADLHDVTCPVYLVAQDQWEASDRG